MKNTIAPFLKPLPLVAVLRGIKTDEVAAVADALIGAGFRMLEVTLNSPRPLESIERLSARCAVRTSWPAPARSSIPPTSHA